MKNNLTPAAVRAQYLEGSKPTAAPGRTVVIVTIPYSKQLATMGVQFWTPEDLERGFVERAGTKCEFVEFFYESGPTRAVAEEVLEERSRQERKWGQQNHPAIEYLAILGEEVGEAHKEALEAHFGYSYTGTNRLGEPFTYIANSPAAKFAHFKDLRKELIQVAAVAVAIVESLDRNELKNVTIKT